MLQEISNNLATPTESPAKKNGEIERQEFSRPVVKSMSRVFGSAEGQGFENFGGGFEHFVDGEIDLVTRALTFSDFQSYKKSMFLLKRKYPTGDISMEEEGPQKRKKMKIQGLWR